MMKPAARILAIAALLFAPARLPAQNLAEYDYENLAFRGIGFDWGVIWPTRVQSTSLYTLRLDLGYLGPAVRIVPSLSYWSSQFKMTELSGFAERLSQLPPLRDQGVAITGADLGKVDWSDLSLALDAHVVWTVPGNVLTFVGAGAAVHALNGRGDVIADTFVEDLLDSTTAGLAILAGAEYQPTPRLRIYGEARYTIASDVRYPGLRIGAALMLPSGGEATGSAQGGR